MPRPLPILMANLRRSLQQELGLMQQMVVLAEAETEILIANQALRLSALETKQKQLLEQQKALETNRNEIVRELAWALEMEHVPVLSELLPHLSGREEEALNRLRTQLLTTYAQWERTNDRNRRLLANALEYVQFSLYALTNVALKPARYGTNLASLATPTFYIDSKA